MAKQSDDGLRGCVAILLQARRCFGGKRRVDDGLTAGAALLQLGNLVIS